MPFGGLRLASKKKNITITGEYVRAEIKPIKLEEATCKGREMHASPVWRESNSTSNETTETIGLRTAQQGAGASAGPQELEVDQDFNLKTNVIVPSISVLLGDLNCHCLAASRETDLKTV